MAATDDLKDDPTLASRYLADQLSEEERAAYEARLLEDPRVLAELEATARLKVGLENLQRSGDLERLMRPRAPFTHPGVWGMAASVAVLAIGLVLWRGTHTQVDSLLAASAAALVSPAGDRLELGGSYALLRTRGDRYDAVVSLPATPQVLEFRVLPDMQTDESAEYRVTVTRLAEDGSATPVAEIGDLESGQDGFVTFYADSSRLAPGRYEVAIETEPDSADAHVRETFIVRMAPTAR